ncbi:hypothetical protein NC652_040440 [Populus alba x Populus x berolinensis]|nr:hypothetical protein NC652_040440 [Populus alba x Populus x berolinensis]
MKYEYITSRWKAHVERKRLLANYGPTEVTFSGKFGKSITIQNFLWKWLLVQEEEKNGCICIWQRSKWGFSYSSHRGRSQVRTLEVHLGNQAPGCLFQDSLNLVASDEQIFKVYVLDLLRIECVKVNSLGNQACNKNLL